jgi:peptidoglycan/xylan/chitin deacetylase (PgdA/CDA1 family)
MKAARFKQSQTECPHLPAWPSGHKAAVSLTFDLDADVGASWRGMNGLLTTMSGARFGVGRGLERLLGVMDAHGVSATFFVPGEIAELHRAEVLAVAEAGHEVGHHGHFHLAIDRIREAEQRDEFFRGLKALEKLNVRPSGYRCPGFELTPFTLDLLVQEGFRYDSSCMGDDRPYYLATDADRLLELPIHWSLDDWVFFRFAAANIYDGGGTMSDPQACMNTWRAEVENAIEEERHVTITMHPEVMGRGYRSHVFSEFVGWLKNEANVWIATCEQVADHVEKASIVESDKHAPARVSPSPSVITSEVTGR